MIEKCIEILNRLVSIDTSIENSTSEAVNYVRKIFDNHSLESHLIPYDCDANRFCLIASTGNIHEKGIILSGHLDTYGVKSQLRNWKTDPFTLTHRDDLLIGRGVVDMKGAIASALSMLDEFKTLNIPVHFVFTHDEEGGFKGINQLINHNFYDLLTSDQFGCIVMEPTSFCPVIKHQGYKKYIIQFVSKEFKNNNSDAYTDLHESIENIYRSWSPYIDTNATDFDIYLNFRELETNKKYAKAIEYQIKFSEKNAKEAENFIQRIKIQVNKFNYSQTLKNSLNRAKISFKNMVFPYSLKTNNIFFQTISDLLPNNNGKTMTFGTEAGYFQKFGIKNTLIFGPGNYNFAHRSNETISVEDLKEYSKILLNIVKKLEKEKICSQIKTLPCTRNKDTHLEH